MYYLIEFAFTGFLSGKFFSNQFDIS